MSDHTIPAPTTATRVVHCRRESYDVYIGRGRDPRTGEHGRWGNPFSHQSGTLASSRVGSREEAIACYGQRLLADPDLLARLPELTSKTLGCWCAPNACHGDVLARYADSLRDFVVRLTDGRAIAVRALHQAIAVHAAEIRVGETLADKVDEVHTCDDDDRRPQGR